MVVRKRVLAALGSAAALVGALATGASPGLAAQNDVTFSFQTAELSVAKHFTHSPTGGAAATETSPLTSGEEGQGTISPKGGNGHRSDSSSAAGSDNSVNESDRSSDATPPTSSSFIGQQSSATTCHYFLVGCNPPDMALAVSPNFVLQGVNAQFAVYDTAGNVQPGFPVSAQKFFGIPNVTNANGTPCDVAHLSQPFISDPRAAYDPVDKRFWAAILQLEGTLINPGGGSRLCPFQSLMWVAVSQTSDPRGKWNVYAFNTSVDGAFANDYTQLGFNGQAIFVSMNMFGPTGFCFYAEVFEANKKQMEHGLNNFTPDAFFNMQVQGPGITAQTGPFLVDTLQPAMNLDDSTGSSETFVQTMDGPDPLTSHFCGFTGGGFADACSGIGVWRMDNPIAHDHGGPAPRLSANYEATLPFLVSPAQTQPSCSHCVDALDLRTTGTPVVRDGLLYSTWDTAVRNATQVVPGIEWQITQLDEVGSGHATTSGYYNFSGNGSATFGTLMPDENGNVLMVFDHMSSTVFPEIRYIVKGADEKNFTGPGVLLKAGEASYRPQLCGTGTPAFVCRWGDFEATSFDGAGHIWFASQYANTLQLGAPQNGRNWGTWIGAINAS